MIDILSGKDNGKLKIIREKACIYENAMIECSKLLIVNVQQHFYVRKTTERRKILF